jgi:hypothetical protein
VLDFPGVFMHTLEDSIQAINERAEALQPGERFNVQGLPADIYHGAVGYGSTAIRAATQSMAHFWSYQHTQRSVSPAMLLGTVTHLLVFEPEELDRQFVVQPDHLKPGNNNAWKAWKEEQTRQILTQEDLNYCSAIANSVLANVGQFFTGGTAEHSFWYRHETGQLLKARADYILGDAIVDLKTTRAGTPAQFTFICRDDYAIQDALYRLVTDKADMVFVGVSKEAPFQTFMAKQGKDVRVNARNKIQAALDALTFAQEFGEYPLPNTEVLETSLRPWD